MLELKKPRYFLKTKGLKTDIPYPQNMKNVEGYLEYIKTHDPLSFLSDLLFPHLVGSEWILIRKCFLLLLVSQNTPDSNVRIGLNMLLVGGPGCFTEGTYITLNDGTFKPIEQFGKNHLQLINQKIRGIKLRNTPLDDNTLQFHKYENVLCYEIITDAGRRIECSFNQQFMGEETWIRADQLSIGDKIWIARAAYNRKKRYIALEAKNLYEKEKTRRKYEHKYILDQKLASLFGYAYGDGNIHRRFGKPPYGISLIVNQEEKDIIPLLSMYIKDKFNMKPKITRRKIKPSYIGKRFIKRKQTLTYIELNNLMLGSLFSFLQEKSKKRTVPDYIMKSPKKIISSFLRWYFEADGSCSCGGRGKNSINLASNSIQNLRDIQLLLLGYGIQSKISGKNLRIRKSIDIQIFAENIGFVSEKKQEKIKNLLQNLPKRRHRHTRFERVKSVLPTDYKTVYDVTTTRHELIANGFRAHNTGKTEMLTWNELHMGIDMINSEYTTKCGLCADARGREITPGFLPNHTGKIVGIDELDKMKHEDQNGLLQAMEEGKFRVIKGKCEECFEAEIRATATCNEIEKILTPLVDRFDFVFRVHQSNRQNRAVQSRKIVEQFFNLPDRTNAMIVQRYLDWIKEDVTKYESIAEMNKIQDLLDRYINTTRTNIDKVSYRSLELSFIRIAYGFARLERKQITVEHMKQAISLKDMILKSFVGVI